jgi:hypothetical protein
VKETIDDIMKIKANKGGILQTEKQLENEWLSSCADPGWLLV